MIKIRQGGVWKEIHDDSKQDAITSTNKLSADLIQNGTTNVAVTETEKDAWDAKQEALTSGTNIKTINGNTILGSGDLEIATEPAAYIKKIEQSSNVYTATKKDDSTVSWTIPDISGKADTTALNNYILKTAIDDVTIKFNASNQLTATIPSVMVFKGSKDYVSEILALTDMKQGDVWYAEKDDRTEPQATAPVVNALICYDGTNWVYAGSTEIDMSAYQTKITATAKLSADLVDDASTTNKFVTAAEKTEWSGKQASLSTEQLAAANSGITSTKVGTYDGYATTIAGKQNQVVYSATEPATSEDGDVWVY